MAVAVVPGLLGPGQAFLMIVRDRCGCHLRFPVSYRARDAGLMRWLMGSPYPVTPQARYGGHELAGAALGSGAVAPAVRFVVAWGDDEPAGPWACEVGRLFPTT